MERVKAEAEKEVKNVNGEKAAYIKRMKSQEGFKRWVQC